MNALSESWLRPAGAVAWRHFHKWVTVPANFIPTVAFPTVFFVAFAGGLSQLQNIPGFDYAPGYTAFQYCFVMLQTAAFGGIATGFSIGGDFSTGFATRMLLTTEHRFAIVLGYMASTLVRAVIIELLVTAMALVAGMDVLGSPLEFATIFGLAAIVNLASTMWASGVMLRARSPSFAPAMQMPVFISIFLAPAYVPYALLQGWVHTVATYNPMTYFLEAFRSLLAGDPEHVLLALGCALGLFAVMLGWSLRGVRSAERSG